MKPPTHFIAIDWGTSYLRAFLCKTDSQEGLQVIEQATNYGVMKVKTDFKTTLLESITPWIKQLGALDIIMCGQIGSNLGWEETPYMPCPISPIAVVSAGVTFKCNDSQVIIMPGISCQHAQFMDAMRGEETQILGWLHLSAANQKGTHLLCLPGTHTKWVLVNNGIIEVFKTALTGELYDVLSNNSVLIQEKATETDFDLAAFDQGMQFIIQNSDDNFSQLLFAVRSLQVFGRATAKQAHCYLSGLLIAHDVKAALNSTEWDIKGLAQVTIIGEPHLSHCFSRVLSHWQMSTQFVNLNKATLKGFEVAYHSMNAHLTERALNS